MASEPPVPPPLAAAKPPHPRRRHRGSVVGPVILIAVGLIFLMNNLGVLPWTIWDTLVRFWPVILILVGLDILIGRRSTWGTIAMLIVVIVLVAVLVWAALFVHVAGGVSERFSVPAGSATRADITLDPAVAELAVGGVADPAVIAQGDIIHPAGDSIARNVSVANGSASITIATGRSEPTAWLMQPSTRNRWQIRLGRGFPIALAVHSGVGESTLDLTGLAIDRLEVDTGVGAAKVLMPSTGTITARVQTGVGEVVVVVPASLATRIHADPGVGEVKVPAAYRSLGDNEYASGATSSPTGSPPAHPAGFFRPSTLDLTAQTGVGEVRIEQAP